MRFAVGSSATDDQDCDDDDCSGGGGVGFGEVDDGHDDLRIYIFWNLMLCRWMSESWLNRKE